MTIQVRVQTDTETIVEAEIVVCPFCKFKSKDREQLKKHINNIHIEKETENKVQDNINSHSFKCGLCANEFSEFDSLKLHMETNHNSNQPAETSSCKYCGLVFLNSNLLNEHIGAYHVTKRITCRYCDFSCDESESYQNHMIEAHEDKLIVSQWRLRLINYLIKLVSWENLNMK